MFLARALSAEPLADVLARMDAAAREFQSFSAKVKRVEFTAVLNESSERSGSVLLRRTRSGASGIMEFGEPDPSVVRFGGRTVETFYPRANTVEVIDIGKNAGAVEQFLLLGFGTTGAEIRRGYDTKLGGVESIGAVHTTRIELFPKGREAKNLVAKIELWIPEGQANPIQEKVTRPSKDYTLISYSETKLNAPPAESAFELKLPANVRKIYPQK
jgi:outer membrane lipoprotein-sorting protein